MPEIRSEPTLRDKIYKLRGKHGEAKVRARCKIQNAIQEALNEFQEETGGFFITSIAIEIRRHYHSTDCDMAIISSIQLKSDIEENF